MFFSEIFSYAVFTLFALCLAISCLVTIFSKNLIKSIMFLILSFFSAAVIWVFLYAEYIAMSLMLVYIGAVMTLFLFIIMLSNTRINENGISSSDIQGSEFVNYSFVSFLIILALFISILFGFLNNAFSLKDTYNHTFYDLKNIGVILYTQYSALTELTGGLLLVALVAAINISRSFKEENNYTNKNPDYLLQMSADPKKRIKLVKMS